MKKNVKKDEKQEIKDFAPHVRPGFPLLTFEQSKIESLRTKYSILDEINITDSLNDVLNYIPTYENIMRQTPRASEQQLRGFS